MNKRFEAIIIKCQELRNKFGLEYEQKCKKQIEKYSKEIIEKDLINKCAKKHYAMQLCMMNGLQFEQSNNMYIDDLIAKLKCLREEHGNLPMRTSRDNDYWGTLFSQMTEENVKVVEKTRLSPKKFEETKAVVIGEYF